MNSSELKSLFCQAWQDSHFFDRGAMRFFGDRMANYGVRQAVIDTDSETDIPVWELFRRRPVKHGLKMSAYFRRDTFAIVSARIKRENI